MSRYTLKKEKYYAAWLNAMYRGQYKTAKLYRLLYWHTIHNEAMDMGQTQRAQVARMEAVEAFVDLKGIPVLFARGA